MRKAPQQEAGRVGPHRTKGIISPVWSAQPAAVRADSWREDRRNRSRKIALPNLQFYLVMYGWHPP